MKFEHNTTLQAVLEELLREHGRAHLRDRFGRREAAGRDGAGAAGAPVRGKGTALIHFDPFSSTLIHFDKFTKTTEIRISQQFTSLCFCLLPHFAKIRTQFINSINFY